MMDDEMAIASVRRRAIRHKLIRIRHYCNIDKKEPVWNEVDK